MQSNFDACLKHLLVHEGGYVNHPSDPGGRTNLGVTQRVWEEWKGGPSDEEEMRGLTVEKVTPLYKKRFWDAARCDDLPNGVDYLVFDFAVNAGVVRSAKTLQNVAGVTGDGVIGPLSIAAVNSMKPEVFINEFSDNRATFYKALSTFPTFGKGWLRRVEESRATALSMLEDKHG